MKRRLQEHALALVRAQAQALRIEAEVEMTESKKRCPVYSPTVGDRVDHVGGTLRASGHVEPVVVEGAKMHVDLVYGGAAQAYAIVQHENLDYHHNVGQAKYLESVLMESLPSMGARIAERIKENLG
jgi:hypothetical protein